jgi:hypothetical protein
MYRLRRGGRRRRQPGHETAPAWQASSVAHGNRRHDRSSISALLQTKLKIGAPDNAVSIGDCVRLYSQSFWRIPTFGRCSGGSRC